MALDFSELTKVSWLLEAQDAGNGIRRVCVAAIQPDPNQPRKAFDEVTLAELAESMRSVGIIQPPVVRTQDSGYLLISGERRWRAARQLGWEKIDVIVRDDLNAHAQLVENIQRDALSPWEIYRVIAAELDAGSTQAELARALGKSKAWIAAYAAVDHMPESLVTALREGRVTGITALGHLHRLLEDTPSTAAQLLNSSTPISRSMIEQARKEASVRKPAQMAVASAPQEHGARSDGEELLTQGTKIVAPADNVPLPSRDITRHRKSGEHQSVRIRAHYENACWLVDYMQQRELDGAVSVRLERDDGNSCFAPIGALRLQSIEHI